MHRITTRIIATAMLLMPLAASAQNTYVSKPAADLISSGHYFIRFDGKVHDPEQNTDIKMQIATAVKDGVSCTFNESAEALTLNTAKGTFMLDVKAKNYRVINQTNQTFNIGRLTFQKQGTCKLNGKDFYFDEYRSTLGNKVRFFYNSTKIAAVDFGAPEMPVVNISTLDKKIPQNMILCLSPEWKSSGGGAGGVPNNMQQQIIEQMRKEIDPNDLPPGMTVDDMINMALGRMNGGAAQNRPTTPAIEPPKCAQPYNDPSPSNDLADPTSYSNIQITDIKYLTTPVYASKFSKPKTQGVFNPSMEVTEEGVKQQLQALDQKFANMSVEQIEKYMTQASSDIMTAIQFNLVNGSLIEYSLALCVVNPTALNYNNAGILMAYKGETENAKDLFMQALAIDNQNAIVQVNLANYYLEKGDLINARKYAENALSTQPDFGEAYQILTGVNIKENKFYEATTTLFKSAETFFNDITAMQFFSLIYNLKVEQHKVANNPSYPYMNVVNKVFTKENLESLTRATKAGGVSNGQDVIQNMKEFSWPVNNAEIWQLHESYLSKSNHKVSNALTKLNERNKEVMDQDRYAILYYESMGMQNANKELERTEGIINQLSEKNVSLHLPELDMYQRISNQMANDNEVIYYPDARQFWCLKMWECYYEIMLQYHEGFWYDPDNGNPVNYPAIYPAMNSKFKALENNLEIAFNNHKKRLEEIDKNLAKCLEKAKTERGQVRCQINAAQQKMDAGETYVRGKVQSHYIDIMHQYKECYNREIKPTLEEWWQKTIAMGAYCDKYAVMEYFENDVLHAANISWLDNNYRKAWENGKMIQNNWDLWVERPRRERDSLYEILAELPPDPPQPPQQMSAGGSDGLGTGDHYLKTYGEKERPWIEVGFDAGPLGRIGLRRESNGDISITNEGNVFTGTNKKWNLSNGETTTTGYLTLADQQRIKDKGGFTSRVADYMSQKAEGVPLIGRVIAAAKNHSEGTGFQPFLGEKSGQHTAITTDANGHFTGSTHIKFREIQLRNLPLNITLHTEDQRTGTYRRTKMWVGADMAGFGIRMGN